MEISDPRDSATLVIKDLQSDLEKLKSGAYLFGFGNLIQEYNSMWLELQRLKIHIEKEWKL